MPCIPNRLLHPFRTAATGVRALVPALALAWALAPAAAQAAPQRAHLYAETQVPVTRVEALGSAVVNFAEMARQEALVLAASRPPVRALIENEHDGEDDVVQPDIRGVQSPSGFAVGRQLNIASPAPTRSFAGLDDIAMVDSQYIIIPPDVNGVVGPTKIFQNLNNNVRILDKTTGTVLGTVGVNTWWASTGASPNNYTDPRSTYDPYNNRFITIVQGDLDQATANTLCLGVSDGSDPSGTWHLYRFSCYENSTYQYADFPTLGFNKNWITISINMYNSSQTQVRHSVFMVHYPTLRSSFTATVFRADYSASNVICGAPAVTYSATQDTEFVIQRLGTSTYGLDKIVGTGPSAPTYTIGSAITRPGGAWNALGTSNYFPQSAPVSGTSVCGATPCAIERSDDNVRTSAIYRNGSLWFAQQVGLPASSTTHAAVQWTQINASSGAFQVGGRLQDTLATTTNGRPHYAEPSISVNANGDFLLGFTRFSSSQHPAAGYAMHVAADGVGTLRDTVIYKAGDDYYHKTFSTNTGRNRWGDFSTTQVDPSDDITLWTVQEYAKARATTDDGTTGSNASRWGTWWAAVTPPTNTFTITASAGANGSISPTGAVVVNQGGTQAFTITPAACYQVADVLVDGVSVGAVTGYTFTNVQASHTISASFAITTYGITASAGTNGSISPTGVTTVNCGGSQHYVITPNTGYHVADVLVDGSSVGAVAAYDFTNVQAAHTIAASFAINVYTITVTQGANGAIAPAGVTGVNYGGSQHYTITPNTGYHVVDVTVDGSSAGAVTTYDFTTVTTNHTLTASFAINTYTITATQGANGTIAPAGVTTVNYGGSQHYTITPGSNFHVVDVLVDGSSVGAVTAYDFTTVAASHTITASFALNTWAITATAGAHGSIAPPGVTNVATGGGQHYTITPDTGYHVADVKVDGFSSGPVTLYDFADVTANHTIDASFAINVYTVTATSGAHGTVAPPGVTSVNSGGSQAYTITADPGYAILDVLVDSVSVGPVLGYNFTGVTANHKISATFKDITLPSVLVTSPNGGEQWNVGSSQNITWTASDNEAVDSVNVDYSLNGEGGPWVAVVHGLGNTGTYAWTVPGPATDSAVVRVTAFDHAQNQASDASDSLFQVLATVGVEAGGGQAVFWLSHPVPNPTREGATLRFSLARRGDTTLEIVGVNGRVVWRSDMAGLNPGEHALTWNGHDLSGRQAPTGIYFIRLQSGGQVRKASLVLLR